LLSGAWWTTALYVAASVLAGLLAVQVGVLVARAWF
jgi:fluoride ion exporter CrcB/FEX